MTSNLRPKTCNPQSATCDLKPDSGFTLIELLVSIFIFGVALSAIVYVLTINSNTANLVKNSYVASGLAQEGIEVVRNLRDSDWLAGRPYGGFGNTAEFADGGYRVQWNSQILMSSLDTFLKKDAATGIYSYDAGTDTIFKRAIQLTTMNPGIEKRIVVTVSWTDRGNISRSVSAEEHLFNWR